MNTPIELLNKILCVVKEICGKIDLPDTDVGDCSGNTVTEKALPVAIKGVSNVKDCNSDELLRTQKEILDEVRKDQTDDDLRVQVSKTDCFVADSTGERIQGWVVYDEFNYDESGNRTNLVRFARNANGEEGLPTGATIVCDVEQKRSIERTWERTLVTDSGSIAAGFIAIGVHNEGGNNALLADALLPPNHTEGVVAPQGDVIGEVSYDATGTQLIISTLR